MQPRLVHFAPWIFEIGGAQRVIDLWCRENYRHGNLWDTHVVICKGTNRFSLPGATVHAVEPHEYSRTLLELQPDIAIHHNALTNAGRLVELPWVWHVHSSWVQQQPAPEWTMPEAVICVQQIPVRHPSWDVLPITVIPNWVDIAEYPMVTHGPKETLICGIVGRRHRDKIPLEFLQTLARTDISPWKIRFIGTGLADPAFHCMAGKIIQDTPWLEDGGECSPDESHTVFANLDAVMMPTDPNVGEGCPLTALEAMASGLPIIARRCAGLAQTCGKAAIYAASDGDLLAALQALRDPSERQRLGQYGRELVEQKYSTANWWLMHQILRRALPVEVSILMPVWNTPSDLLLKCWQSILDQSLRRWELVLVDDGSDQEDTLKAIEQIGRHPRVRVIRITHGGISKALNIGLTHCRSELVARMDADDVMLSRRLAVQVAYMQTHPDVDILGSQMICSNGRTTACPTTVTRQWVRDHWDQLWLMNHPTVIYRKSVIQQLGGYNTSYLHAQDLDLWLRALLAGKQLRNLPDQLVIYRMPSRLDEKMEQTQKIVRAITAQYAEEFLRN